MKKVLFVISTLNTGGAQRIFSNIIMALPTDWEIDILLNDSNEIAYPYRGRIIDLQIPPEENKEKVSYQIKALLKRIGILKRLKDENGYDACISAMDSTNFVNILTGNRYCRTIPTIHGYHNKGWAPEKIEPLVRKLVGITYRRADCVVTVSQGLAHEMTEKFHVDARKVVTIYNGYPVDEILQKKEVKTDVILPWGEDVQIVVATGRMEKIKGQWHLIKAFSKVAEKNPKARLLILGDGQLRPELEALVNELKILGKVYMPGFVDNPFAYLGKATLFVMSSLSEGYPNAMAEAIICGIPCVSCDCEAGPREILAETCNKQEMAQGFLKEKYGILTPAFDENDLWTNKEISSQEQIMADAICEMLENSDLYMHYKMKIIDKAKALDMKNVIYEWIDLLQ